MLQQLWGVLGAFTCRVPVGSFVEDLVYIVGGTLRHSCLFIGVCNKVFISLLFTLLNIVFDIFTYDVFHMCETWSWHTYKVNLVFFRNRVWQLARLRPSGLVWSGIDNFVRGPWRPILRGEAPKWKAGPRWPGTWVSLGGIASMTSQGVPQKRFGGREAILWIECFNNVE